MGHLSNSAAQKCCHMTELVTRTERQGLVGQKACKGSRIYCLCVVLVAKKSHKLPVEEIQNPTEELHILENQESNETMKEASPRHPQHKEMICQTLPGTTMAKKLSANLGNACAEHFDSLDYLTCSDMKCVEQFGSTSTMGSPLKSGFWPGASLRLAWL